MHSALHVCMRPCSVTCGACRPISSMSRTMRPASRSPCQCGPTTRGSLGQEVGWAGPCSPCVLGACVPLFFPSRFPVPLLWTACGESTWSVFAADAAFLHQLVVGGDAFHLTPPACLGSCAYLCAACFFHVTRCAALCTRFCMLLHSTASSGRKSLLLIIGHVRVRQCVPWLAGS